VKNVSLFSSKFTGEIFDVDEIDSNENCDDDIDNYNNHDDKKKSGN
jgi:hypothetical protein